ncbi:hypothetical protein RFI_34360 [Reticulomyxa filosa]|uniref:Uncharacterized protein n=1 Tax=Reticulomyxa filosa TaxID=46433 RepID=X6LNU7_RETFI|nr:hypothetical protein RFI_34360 [Reticulomyxa filosa]|eukprot:ETO03051.1 hypothetical protein RFI_34360 [Reticulomyxa filosa]
MYHGYLHSKMSVKFCLQDEKAQKEVKAWNAKVESEDEYTQMTLLTWVVYDQYIQQTMQLSAMWNHEIDANLIYALLSYLCKGDVNKTNMLLFVFEQWRFQDNNEQKYKDIINTFLKRRCCNHNINLFCMFFSEIDKGRTAIEHATLTTINNGLPFVSKNKNL